MWKLNLALLLRTRLEPPSWPASATNSHGMTIYDLPTGLVPRGIMLEGHCLAVVCYYLLAPTVLGNGVVAANPQFNLLDSFAATGGRDPISDRLLLALHNS